MVRYFEPDAQTLECRRFALAQELSEQWVPQPRLQGLLIPFEQQESSPVG
jgi:hypothetical protein